MTFVRQVWWSRVLGAGLTALSMALAALVEFSGKESAGRLSDLATTFLSAGVMLGIFGGIFRPAHRWLWWYAIAPSTLYTRAQKRRAAIGPMKWWLHLDSELRDRDGVKGVGHERRG